jgi:glycosyltransferase involved in cell wall biosynthesis
MLAASLEALKAALRDGDEVVVVDSASRAGGTARVTAEAGVRLVRCDKPGASRARNLGLTATTSRIVAYTDDDCLADPGFAGALDEAFVDPAVGFVCGAVLGERAEGPSVSTTSGESPLTFEGPQDPVEIGHGANMAFRREALVAVGGLDERLGAGATLRGSEDKDVFWRLLRAGWTGRYDPRVIVTHRQWRGRAQVATTNFGYGLGAGAFAVKVIRIDGRPGWQMLRAGVWDRGLTAAVRAARARHEQGVLDTMASTAGVVLGALRGSVTPIHDGRFRS